MHMLAYLFDPEEPELARERELVRDDRTPRAQAMVGKLQGLGVDVTWEQVARIAGNGSVGRPHIATAMVELGVVPTV
ncbi:phosphatase, partial [Streptomyces sp. WAC07061]